MSTYGKLNDVLGPSLRKSPKNEPTTAPLSAQSTAKPSVEQEYEALQQLLSAGLSLEHNSQPK